MESEPAAMVHFFPKVKRDGRSEHKISSGLRGRKSTKLAQGPLILMELHSSWLSPLAAWGDCHCHEGTMECIESSGSVRPMNDWTGAEEEPVDRR